MGSDPEVAAHGSIPDERPVRGSFFDADLLGLSGLELHRLIAQNRLPLSPISRLTGLHLVHASEGEARFDMPASGWLRNEHGLLQSGTLAILADGPLTSAIMTTLPSGSIVTTAQMTMNIVDESPGHGEVLSGRGRLVGIKDGLALSEATISRDDGDTLAIATSWCAVVTLAQSPPPPKQLPPISQPLFGTPDPYLRPIDEPLSIAPAMGLQLLRRQISGHTQLPPAWRLMGIRPRSAERGSVRLEMAASPWLCPPAPQIQGGVVAFLGETAAQSAASTSLEPGAVATTLEFKVNFIRPVPADAELVTAEGRIIHRGRRLIISDVDIHNAANKRIALARGTIRVQS